MLEYVCEFCGAPGLQTNMHGQVLCAKLVYTGKCDRGQPSKVEQAPGRNEQCWCGSGLKYKKCCLKTKTDAATS